MYTDGADSRSTMSLKETVELLRASHATVYAVGLVENAGGARMESQQRLRMLAETTGGQAFFPGSLKDLDRSYEQVLNEIRAQYQLGYLSSNPAADGRWRKVEVKVKRPGLKVRARKGYFACVQALPLTPPSVRKCPMALWYHWVFLLPFACRLYTTGSPSPQTSSSAAIRCTPYPSWWTG